MSYYTELYGGVPQFYSALFTNGLGLADITSVFMYGVFTFLCFFWGYTSLVRRIKAKSMWKGSLLCAVISFGRRVMEAWSVTARAGVILLAFLFILWLAILAHTGATVILALAASIAAAWFVLSSAMAKSRIRKGIEEIASGNLEHRIELNGLRGADKELAEKVNDIGERAEPGSRRSNEE